MGGGGWWVIGRRTAVLAGGVGWVGLEARQAKSSSAGEVGPHVLPWYALVGGT